MWAGEGGIVTRGKGLFWRKLRGHVESFLKVGLDRRWIRKIFLEPSRTVLEFLKSLVAESLISPFVCLYSLSIFVSSADQFTPRASGEHHL